MCSWGARLIMGMSQYADMTVETNIIVAAERHITAALTIGMHK